MSNICALCKKEEELQLSHIIPEFMYGELYDAIHRYNFLSVASDIRDRIEQSGIREKLLCKSCEVKFSRYEGYAKSLFKSDVPGVNAKREKDVLTVSGLDYRKFKLFLISLLWRSGVSSIRFFEEVQLGLHEERMRLMLLNDDPGSRDDYGCVIWGLNLEVGKIPGFMIQPQRLRIYQQNAYRFVLPGYMFVFFVSNKKIPKDQSSLCLWEDGSLIIPIKSLNELPALHGFMGEYERQGRTPPLLKS